MNQLSTEPLEEDSIPISAVQHAVYCLRQAALIHLERLWDDNRFTAEGDVLHAITDKGGRRKVRGVRRVASLPLASKRLNLVGFADLVEFGGGRDNETAYPVEFKRGKPKLHRADEAQLCAQALCLEEMIGRPVPGGALYYAQTRRRVRVPFDSELRELTEDAVSELAVVLSSRLTPAPTSKKSRCRRCSLRDLCRPEVVSRSARQWRDRLLANMLERP